MRVVKAHNVVQATTSGEAFTEAAGAAVDKDLRPSFSVISWLWLP